MHKKLFFYLIIILLAAPVAVLAQQSTSADTVDEEVVVEPVVDTVTTTYSKEIRKSKGSFKDVDSFSYRLVAQRKVGDSAFNAIRKDDDFWYMDGVEEEKKTKEEKSSGFWDWLAKAFDTKTGQVVVWSFLVLLLLTAVILYLRENRIGFFARSSKKLKGNTLDVEISENIFEIDFDAAIAKAISSANYRLATRFLFLRSLKALSNKNVIEYGIDKTNFDYLFQLVGTKYQQTFMLMARNYEYVWYGGFDVTGEQFKAIKNGFDNFEQQLA